LFCFDIEKRACTWRFFLPFFKKGVINIAVESVINENEVGLLYRYASYVTLVLYRYASSPFFFLLLFSRTNLKLCRSEVPISYQPSKDNFL